MHEYRDSDHHFEIGNSVFHEDSQVILEGAAYFAVLVTAAYLVLLGIGALVLPDRTRGFLSGFTSSQGTHLLELALRLLAGTALVVNAPRMQFGAAFAVFGWVLVGSTLALALIPRRVHQRFARWSVPLATRTMPLIGLGSMLMGMVMLYALVFPHDDGGRSTRVSESTTIVRAEVPAASGHGITIVERAVIETRIREHLELPEGAALGLAEFSRITELDLSRDSIPMRVLGGLRTRQRV